MFSFCLSRGTTGGDQPKRKAGRAMEGPRGDKGEVVIRTIFGEIAADERDFNKPIEEIADNPEWREALGLEGGPFCYTDLER